MATPKFPGPNYHRIIEPNSDRQIISVPLEDMGFGARKKSQAKPQDSIGLKIKHVSNEAG